MSTAAFGAGMAYRQSPVRQAPARPRLHLTKRGRGVFTALAATPLVVVALVVALNGGMATASLEGADATFQYVTVNSGETLWQLAETIAPASDPRDVIAQIMQLNQLQTPDVFAGQQLAIPAQYTR